MVTGSSTGGGALLSAGEQSFLSLLGMLARTIPLSRAVGGEMVSAGEQSLPSLSGLHAVLGRRRGTWASRFRHAAPVKMSTSGVRRTLPAEGRNRDSTHMRTSPSQEMAARPSPHLPHSSATFGVVRAGTTPRPTPRTRSTRTRVTPSRSSSARACSVRCPSPRSMIPTRRGMPRSSASMIAARVRAWLPARRVSRSCSAGSSL